VKHWDELKIVWGKLVKSKLSIVLGLALVIMTVGYTNCQQTPSVVIGESSSVGNGKQGADYTDVSLDPNAVNYIRDTEMFKLMPQGQNQFDILCARKSNDRVRKIFCASPRPTLSSLSNLLETLGIGFSKPHTNFAITSQSTSLVTKEVSQINPRAIIFSSPTNDFVALGFARGEKFAEIIANDPITKEPKFYLLKYRQLCDLNSNCTHFDNLTPKVEKNWIDYTIYEDEDLKNTILDCRHCHQPNGLQARKFMRMQETEKPWTHWMEGNLESGQTLIDDFRRAHGATEEYAGIPNALFEQANPPALQTLLMVRGDEMLQLNPFDSVKIEAEVKASSPKQPVDNTFPGKSATWDVIYKNFVDGKAIAVPYHDVKASDPTKLAAMSTYYRDAMAGRLAPKDMPDIRHVFPDNPTLLAEMGFRVKPGLSPQGILMNACAQCHNSKLDSSISRAKFNVDLTRMSREAKNAAIKRLQAPDDSVLKMPPRRIRSLSQDETNQLIELLKK
jgi:hypothetical protein